MTTRNNYELTGQRLVSSYIVSQLSNRLNLSEMIYEDMEGRTKPVDVLEFTAVLANPRVPMDALILNAYLGGNFMQTSPEGNVFEGVIRRQKVVLTFN